MRSIISAAAEGSGHRTRLDSTASSVTSVASIFASTSWTRRTQANTSMPATV
jgi:hypothetical protein